MCWDSAPPQPLGCRNGRLEYTYGLYEEHCLFSLDLLRRCKDFLSSFFYCDKIAALEFPLKMYSESENHAVQKMAEEFVGPEIIRVGLEYTDKKGLLKFLNFTRLCSIWCFKKMDEEKAQVVKDRDRFFGQWSIVLSVVAMYLLFSMEFWCLPYFSMFAVGFVGYLSLYEIILPFGFVEDLTMTKDAFFLARLGPRQIDEVTMGDWKDSVIAVDGLSWFFFPAPGARVTTGGSDCSAASIHVA